MNFIPAGSFEGQELQLRRNDYLFLEIKIEVEPGQRKPVMQSNTTFPVNQLINVLVRKEAHSLFYITTVASFGIFVK